MVWAASRSKKNPSTKIRRTVFCALSYDGSQELAVRLRWTYVNEIRADAYAPVYWADKFFSIIHSGAIERCIRARPAEVNASHFLKTVIYEFPIKGAATY